MAIETTPLEETSGRRRKITKFALAGVAVLGVGAALTSAAWSDNVLFNGSATSGTVDIQGRVAAPGTPGAFANGPIAIPASVFAGMVPSQAKTVTLEVTNVANGDVTLAAPAVSNRAGQFFTGVTTDDIAITWGTYSDPVLSPGESATIVVTLTPPDWDNTAKNILTGNTFSVTIQGTA